MYDSGLDNWLNCNIDHILDNNNENVKLPEFDYYIVVK